MQCQVGSLKQKSTKLGHTVRVSEKWRAKTRGQNVLFGSKRTLHSNMHHRLRWALVSALLIRANNFTQKQCTDNLEKVALPETQHNSSCESRLPTCSDLVMHRSSNYSFVKITFCLIYLGYTFPARPHSKLVKKSAQCNSRA